MAHNDIIKVKLGNVVQNGEVCENPSIELLGAPGVEINCYDADCKEYQIQLPDDFDQHCLQFSILCSNCTDCPPKVIERCFCDDSTECGPCEDCIDGICVAECPPEQCFNDTCKECASDQDCPCDQICLNGNCVCPAGEQLCPGDICCSECCSDSECDICEVCIGGDCVPKDCGEGACNPETGECEECVADGDCGVNECCKDNKCKCCEGYVRDNCTGECVPAPENPCRTNQDCGQCYSCIDVDPCTGWGSCQPAQCFNGKVFSPTPDGECCHKPCDCGEPGSCEDRGYLCETYDDVLCICVFCGSGCPNGDECREGCYCSDNEECLPDSCVGSCTNGTECGPGCGCENGECVRCDSIDCASDPVRCANVLGCECVGQVCTDINGCLQSTCQTENDCGDGCTCYQGECVNCDNFSCVTTDCANQPGCVCVSGNCVGDGDDGCEDSLEITKNDSSCKITGRLTTERCCGCPPITALLKITSVTPNYESGTFTFGYSLETFQGNNTDPFNKLDNTANPKISQNEAPEASYTLSVKQAVSGADYAVASSGSTSASTVNAVATTAIPGSTGLSLKLEISNLTNSANSCTYSGKFEDITITVGDLGLDKTIQILLTSEDCKDPLFTWSKSGDQVFADGSFRKVYVQPSGGVYQDVLPDSVTEGCKTYSLQVDCGCDKSTSKFIAFCNPNHQGEIADCRKRFTLFPGTPCNANKDLEYFVSINGAVEAQGLYGSIVGNYYADDISSAAVGLVCSGDCTKVFTPVDPGVQVNAISECDGENLVVTISNPGNSYEIISAIYNGQVYTATNNVVSFTTSIDTDVTSGVVNIKECGQFPFEFATDDCCDEVDVQNDPQCADGTFNTEVLGPCDYFLVSTGSSSTRLSKADLIAGTGLSFGVIYSVTTDCTNVCASPRPFTIGTDAATCCTLQEPTVVPTAKDGIISVTVNDSSPDAGDYTYSISVLDADGNEIGTETAISVSDPTEVSIGDYSGSYQVVVSYENSSLADLCGSEQGPFQTYTPCDLVEPVISKTCPGVANPAPEFGGTGTQLLSLSGSTGNSSSCPCLDYALNVRWSASFNGTNYTVKILTETPSSTFDTLGIKADDGLDGSSTTIDVSATGLSSSGNAQEGKEYTFLYSPSTNSNLVTIDIAPQTVAGCDWPAQSVTFLVDATASPTGTDSGTTTKTITFSGVDAGNTRNKEVVWYEGPDGDEVEVGRSYVAPFTMQKNGADYEYVSGEDYQAAVICGCVKKMANGAECQECISYDDPTIAQNGVCGDLFDISISQYSKSPIVLSIGGSGEGTLNDLGGGAYQLEGPFSTETVIIEVTQADACGGGDIQLFESDPISYQDDVTVSVTCLNQSTVKLTIDPAFAATYDFAAGQGTIVDGGDGLEVTNPIEAGSTVFLVTDGAAPPNECVIGIDVGAQDCTCTIPTITSNDTELCIDGVGSTAELVFIPSTVCTLTNPATLDYTVTRGVTTIATGTLNSGQSSEGEDVNLVVSTAGTYNIVVTDDCNCSSDTFSITVTEDTYCGADIPFRSLTNCGDNVNPILGRACGAVPNPPSNYRQYLCTGEYAEGDTVCTDAQSLGNKALSGWTFKDIYDTGGGVGKYYLVTAPIGGMDGNVPFCVLNVEILAPGTCGPVAGWECESPGNCISCPDINVSGCYESEALCLQSEECEEFSGYLCDNSADPCTTRCTDPTNPNCYGTPAACRDACYCYACDGTNCIFTKGQLNCKNGYSTSNCDDKCTCPYEGLGLSISYTNITQLGCEVDSISLFSYVPGQTAGLGESWTQTSGPTPGDQVECGKIYTVEGFLDSYPSCFVSGGKTCLCDDDGPPILVNCDCGEYVVETGCCDCNGSCGSFANCNPIGDPGDPCPQGCECNN